MKVGCMVKIEDIGPLAVCVGIRPGAVQLELEGERFWMPVRLVSAVEEAA